MAIVSRLRIYCVQLYLLVVFLLLLVSESRRKSRSSNSKGKSGGSPASGGRSRNPSNVSTGITYTLIALGLCLLPAIGIFLYNLYNDPLTPELLRRAVTTLKSKTLGYLAPSKVKRAKAS